MVKTIEPGVPLSEYELTIQFRKKKKVITLEEARSIISETAPSLREIMQANDIGQVHELAEKIALHMAVAKELKRSDYLRFVSRKGGRRSQRVKRE